MHNNADTCRWDKRSKSIQLDTIKIKTIYLKRKLNHLSSYTLSISVNFYL